MPNIVQVCQLNSKVNYTHTNLAGIYHRQLNKRKNLNASVYKDIWFFNCQQILYVVRPPNARSILGASDTSVNKTDTNACPSVYTVVKERCNKQ